MERQQDTFPLAYFLTMRTYGTWLHGDERGSMDATHNGWRTPRLPPDHDRKSMASVHMRGQPYLLAAESAALVEKTTGEVCVHRGWHLYRVHARTNHVHVVLGAQFPPERIMSDLKAWCTRRLRENGFAQPKQDVWVEHGSTPYLWTEAQLQGAIDYVKNWQGGPLQRTWDQVRQDIDAVEANRTRSVSKGQSNAGPNTPSLANASGSVARPV